MGLAPPFNPSPSPPSPPEPTPTPTPSRDDKTPALFFSGWFYGITGEDDRDYILSCYKVDKDLTDTLYDAMEAFSKGETIIG